MVLKALELHGFKSFPDKTKLNFGDGITAVVGPNGSGKSNISDAIRWVLGEQSTKNLRGTKMEDVVFDGTKARKAMGYAEVSLTFDNAARRLLIDADDVTITRRYYRSGESDYQINHVNVRLKDVHELFMDTGLGRDGYSMIGQGKIADVVSTKSEDRRLIFEEAAGISKYRHRKHDSERQLERTQDNLERLQDLLSVLEERVGPLEEQAKKAKKYIEYAGEKKSLEISVWISSLSKITDTMRELEHKITLARAQSGDCDAALASMSEEFESLTAQSRELTLKIDEIRRESAKNDEEAALIDGEIKVMQNDNLHTESNIERIQNELSESLESQSSLNDEVAEKQAKIQSLKEKIEENSQGFIKCSQALENLNSQSAGFSSQIEELAGTISQSSAALADKRVEAVTCESSVIEIESRNTAVDRIIEEKSALLSGLSAESSECGKDLNRITEELDSLSNTVKGYEYKSNQKKQKLAEQKELADKLTLDAGEKERRCKLLLDLERNLEGFQQSVKAVMKHSERGMLNGIHGPVSRIVSVDKKYAVAIEIALGAAMQNIVVGTEQDAKQAIALLKKEDSGRATFLPISSIRGRSLDEKGLDNCDGFVGIASELVSFDPSYREIANSLLGRIAVAEDLDYAVAIAKKYNYRFRIVTLDGQVVNSGGSLTGGSLARNSGLLSRAGDIERIREDAAKLREKAETARALLKQMEEEQAQIDAAVLGAKAESATLNEDKIRIEGELKRLNETKELAGKEIDGLNAEKTGASERIAALQKTKQTADLEIGRLTKLLADTENEISNLSGGRDNLAQTREQLTGQVSAFKLETATLERDIEAIVQSIEEITVRSLSFEERKKMLLSQIELLKDKIEQTNQNIAQSAEKSAALRTVSSQTDERIADVNNQRDQIDKSVTQLRQTERDRQSEREKITADLARLEERSENITGEQEQIKKQLWEEHNLTKNEAEEIAGPVENLAQANKRLNELKGKIRGLGNVNVDAIEEYKEVSEQYEFLKVQIEDVVTSKNELLKLIHELTNQMRDIFSLKFEQISTHFTEIFKELFGGGSASLEITDKEDVLNSGIDLKVAPPGKIIKNISALSGGEMALVAISIYFAIMKVNPSPFCVLDEVDAALDEVNVDRLAAYLRSMSNNTQFIAITHKRGTMEEADILHGVTMQEEGVSKLLELKASEAAAKLGIK